MSIQNEEDYRGSSSERIGLLTDVIQTVNKPNSKRGTSASGAIFIIVNSALGAGLLALPAAFNEAGGIAIAVSIQFVLILFIIGSLLILIYCAQLFESKTYFDIIESTCGKHFQRVASICIIIYCFGCCITFFIITGDQFDRIFSSYISKNFCQHWYLNRYFTITVSTVIFILPLSFSRRIDFLKIPSTLGVFVCIYIVFLVIYEYVRLGDLQPIIKTGPTVWSDVFVVIPILCFSYQCHVSIVPVYVGMKQKDMKTVTKVIVIAIFICLLLYTIIAVFGYLTFGNSISDDILKNYNANGPVVMIGILSLAFKIFVSYPVLHLVGRSAFDSLWADVRNISNEEMNMHEKRRRYIQTIIWFIGCLLFALFIPGIGLVISGLGSLAAAFIFVFPGMSLLQTVFIKDSEFSKKQSVLLKIISCIFIVIGMFIFGEVIAQTITKGGPPSETLCQY